MPDRALRPFLNELRNELDTYPMCAHDDAMDAVYWALMGMPDVLVVPRLEEEGLLNEAVRREKKESPWKALAAAS